ncbi:MAG: precorrin-4 C(11)-methyltransferase [Desulfobacca sp.]|uniref:precorrin-4 C(11)-methyltransferase n=1 Tax=Desulfobacca sp. TaxID=2067990 RepID=UPI0040495A26
MTERFPILFVGAGPGDPELITVKGQRALAQADLILYTGSLVPEALLTHARPGVMRVDTASLDLEDIVRRLIAGYEAGQRVVRLHTGDPSLYSAIQEQIALLRQAQVPYQVIPGVTAGAAAAAALGQELTIPGITQTVIYTRMAGRTPVPAAESLESLASHGATLVIYLSSHLLEQLVASLIPQYGPETPAVVVYRASWPDEMIIRGTLATIAQQVQAAGIRRQALILVGRALAPAEGQATRSKLYDAAFSHGYRQPR